MTLIYSAFPSLARFVLKGFAKDGRDLTDKETKAFLKAADKDGDGKIGVDGKHPVPLVGISRGHTNRQRKCREKVTQTHTGNQIVT